MNSGWDMLPGSWKDNIPLGKSTQDFILENCQWVLYMRRDTRFTCPLHRDPSTLTAELLEAPCRVCYGYGVRTEPQIVPCRISLGQPHVSHRETERRDLPGWLEYYNAAADFPRGIMPQLEDHVLICEWDKPTQELGRYPRARVLRINSVYVIKQVNDHFERELSHYSVGLEAQDHELARLEMHLPVLRNVSIVNLDPDPLGVGQWPNISDFW